jgi:hypothetical protein
VNRTAFYGTIYTGDVEVVQHILQAWVGGGSLKVKITLSGEDITYETEKLYLYCHNAIGDQGFTPYYLLEGHTNTGLDETRQMLEKLLQSCKEQKVVGSFEYVEVNEAGDEVSDQFEVA